jgi:hypothetical protein
VKLSLLGGVFVWISFEAKNVFFLSIFGGCSIKYKKCHVHRGKSCKIAAPKESMEMRAKSV